MSRQARAAFTMVAIALMLGASTAPASARPKGRESFDGVIVVNAVAGARHTVHDVVVARGVLNGLGHIVEVASLPSDPETVVRDDLVFAAGTLHIVSTDHSIKVLSMNPTTCEFDVLIRQTGKVKGGTKRFRHASGSFAGTVRAHGIGGRGADGSCAQDQPSLLEVDIISSRGSLST